MTYRREGGWRILGSHDFKGGNGGVVEGLNVITVPIVVES